MRVCLFGHTLIALFLYQPVFHVLHRTLAPEVELHVVQGISDFLEWGVGVETGIVAGQDVADVAQAQPLAVYIILWPTLESRDRYMIHQHKYRFPK